MADKRIAIVHPWVVERRGGEQVFFELARLLPQADLFLLLARRGSVPADLARRVHTSFLQKMPLPKGTYRLMLPLLPAAAESLDLERYDLVVSSSSGWAHGVRVGPGAAHVCYMHTPPRYLWGTPAPTTAGRVLQPVSGPLLARLRAWDAGAAAKVSGFVANSAATAARIEECYGREAEVVYPPVDVDHFRGLRRQPDGSVLFVGELVGYKRIDRVIRACMMLDVPLTVAGDGPERGRLVDLARGSKVTFAGRISDAARDGLLSRASVFAYGGVEDFGITFVEALAAGLPIAGIRAGGLAEIGVKGGVAFAKEASAEALAEAIAACLERPGDYTAPELGERFRRQRFQEGILRQIAAAEGAEWLG